MPNPDPDLRRYAPATERNRQPILDVLQRTLPASGRVLEIGSGTGEHAVFFAQAQPGWTWLPSEGNAEMLPSIQAWIDHAGAGNVEPPRVIDVQTTDWGVTSVDAIVCCNVIHYSAWDTTPALLDGAARLLRPGGVLYLYGPYRRGGLHTAPSNEAFDQWLKQRDPAFGVRNLEDVQAEAARRGLAAGPVIDMPANNLSVIFTAG
ncbi:DUF938 domain-containing protein [Bordetella ansorpii]|uniref:DUF938 domain-containing protein n=1 Tax=Bordetella ansorpii TaxID=288768 RepID=UPI0008245EBD